MERLRIREFITQLSNEVESAVENGKPNGLERWIEAQVDRFMSTPLIVRLENDILNRV